MASGSVGKESSQGSKDRSASLYFLKLYSRSFAHSKPIRCCVSKGANKKFKCGFPQAVQQMITCSRANYPLECYETSCKDTSSSSCACTAPQGQHWIFHIHVEPNKMIDGEPHLLTQVGSSFFVQLQGPLIHPLQTTSTEAPPICLKVIELSHLPQAANVRRNAKLCFCDGPRHTTAIPCGSFYPSPTDTVHEASLPLLQRSGPWSIALTFADRSAVPVYVSLLLYAPRSPQQCQSRCGRNFALPR